MEVKTVDGIMTVFRMRTGKVFVKSTMPVAHANRIIAAGKSVEEKDGEIIVDDTYFFTAQDEPDEQTADADPVTKPARKSKKKTEGAE